MYDMIPDELRALRQWVCWQAFPDNSKPGKIKKVPINAMTGDPAQSNNPDTWASFDAAERAAVNFSGIGFMFANGYFGIDIDGCDDAIADFKAGGQDNIVAEFVHTLQSYAEYSVSGKGIHIICRGKLPPSGRRRMNVEMYQDGRFFIVTGNTCSEYVGIEDCTQSVKPLHEKYIGGGRTPTTGITKVLPLNLSETEVIKLAEKSKQGTLFSDLYAGRWQSYYRSQSEADMSLCNILAFWCRKDEQLMDKVFRSSGLMRDKWDRKQAGSTYGVLTISKAARDCANVYEPKPDYAASFGASSPTQREGQKKQIKLYTFDDTGNAERFTDTFGESLRYNYTAKNWMYYDGRRWCEDATGAVKRMTDEVVEEMRHGLAEYLDHAPQDDLDEAEKQYVKHLKASRSSKSKIAMLKESEHRVPITPDELDTHNSLLCVTNGVINLRTGELLPHDKKHLISKICYTEYTDKIDYPLWEKFLLEIFDGDRDLIRYIQKAVGYSLTGSTQEHCAFFLYGTGRNGKSTFVDTINGILGDYAVNIQPETLMVKQANSGGPTGDIARLKGARFVTTSEPNEGVRLNEGLLKQLTGGNKITASKKYENEFEFYPEFKLWMETNHKPVVRGTDVGIWSRIKLIPFTVQIPEDRIDKRLKHKLRQEMSGILKWAVDGCLLWQREGLKPPSTVEAASREYKNEMDVLAAFLDECTEQGGEVNSGDLFRAYAAWAKESNEFEMSATRFGREMGKRYEKRKYNTTYYVGLSLLSQRKPYTLQFTERQK